MNGKYLKIKELFDLALQHYKKNNFLSAEKLYKEIFQKLDFGCGGRI